MVDVDEPTFEHDELIDHMLGRAREEGERKSDASESAAKVKELVEKTGVNSKAYSWGKQTLKTLSKKHGQTKAMDIIRSLKRMLPMLEDHVQSQGTADMDFGEPAEPADDDGEDSIEADEADFEEAVGHAFSDDDDGPPEEDKVVRAFGG